MINPELLIQFYRKMFLIRRFEERTAEQYALGKIENVELVGFPGKLQWTRKETGLEIQLPEQKPSEHAVAFRISGSGLV